MGRFFSAVLGLSAALAVGAVLYNSDVDRRNYRREFMDAAAGHASVLSSNDSALQSDISAIAKEVRQLRSSTELQLSSIQGVYTSISRRLENVESGVVSVGKDTSAMRTSVSGSSEEVVLRNNQILAEFRDLRKDYALIIELLNSSPQGPLFHPQYGWLGSKENFGSAVPDYWTTDRSVLLRFAPQIRASISAPLSEVYQDRPQYSFLVARNAVGSLDEAIDGLDSNGEFMDRASTLLVYSVQPAGASRQLYQLSLVLANTESHPLGALRSIPISGQLAGELAKPSS